MNLTNFKFEKKLPISHINFYGFPHSINMGNSSAKAKADPSPKEGFIKITLDKSGYTAGETIKGTIELSLHTPFLSDTLVLEIKGYEKTSVSRKLGNQGCCSSPPKAFTKSTMLINNRAEIKSPVKDLFPSGKHVYPFVLQLSADLPSTYSYKFSTHDGSASAQVHYELLSYTFSKKLSRSIGCTVPLNVRALKELVEPQHQFSTSFEIPNAYSQNNKHVVGLTVNLKSNRFTKGDMIDIICDLDLRESNTSINKVQVKLLQLMTVKVDQAGLQSTKVVWEKSIKQTYAKGFNHVQGSGAQVSLAPEITNDLPSSAANLNFQITYALQIYLVSNKAPKGLKHPGYFVFELPIELLEVKRPITNYTLKTQQQQQLQNNFCASSYPHLSTISYQEFVGGIDGIMPNSIIIDNMNFPDNYDKFGTHQYRVDSLLYSNYPPIFGNGAS